jgi:hypothetical protein
MNDLALIRNELGLEMNSPTPANPLFVNAASNNFNLQSGSPAIHAGLHIPEVAIDYEGNPYDPTNPSIGAFED